jgi:hypothetical protein
MKKSLLILATIGLTAFAMYDVFEELSISQDKGKEYLVNSIVTGLMSSDDDLIQRVRSMSVESQVQVMKQLMQFAKSYTQTDEFKESYKKWRKNKLNPEEKTKLGLPKFGKMLDNKINNKMDKAENEKNYPSDPNELIKQRLTVFLKISATVDFDAELNDAHGFKNPEYERKGGQWKMCFRAGREVVAAAREEAQKWLDEIK